MTVPSTSRSAGPLAGNSVATQFPFTFKVFAKTDVKVVHTTPTGRSTLVLDSNYSVTLNADQNTTPGGYVTFPLSGSPIPSTESLLITGNSPYSQSLSLPGGGNFNPAAVEAALDRLEFQIQQLRITQLATLRVPDGETLDPLPTSALRASRLPAFDADGGVSAIVGVVSDSAAALAVDLLDSATAGRGDALVGQGGIVASVNGQLTRYPSIAEAVTGIGASRATIEVRRDTALGINTTIPSNVSLRVSNNAQITLDANLTVNGRFFAEAGQCFTSTGVVSFGSSAKVVLRADWWPATAAGLQAAITAAAGRAINLSGAYSLGSTTITVPANTWLCGREFAGTWTGNVTGLSFTNGGGFTGGTLTGAGNASYVDAGRAVACFGTNNAPSAPTFVNAPVIRDATITEWSGYGVFLGYTNGGAINDCTITEIGYAGVAGVSCNDLAVRGNRVSTVNPGTTDAYGIFVDRQDQASETAYPRSYRVRITGNDIRDVRSTSGNNGQAINTHAGVDFVIADNNIEGCEVGIFVTASPSGTQAFAPKGVVVANNTIRDTLRLGYGIQVSGAINGSTVAEYAENIVVKGNTVFGHGIAGDGTSGAIRVQVTRGLVLANNTVRSPACNGIVFNTENIGFQAVGNTIIDPFDNSYASPACYFFDSNNNSGVLASGSLYYQNSGLGTNVATHSVRTDSGLSGLDIRMGPHILINVDSTHLTFDLDTTTGVNKTGFYEESGTTSLSAGSVNISFNKRFPSVPVASVVGGSDLNPVRVSTISETGMTVTGTGSTSIYWRAST